MRDCIIGVLAVIDFDMLREDMLDLGLVCWGEYP